MRDVQRRLVAAGFAIPEEELGSYGAQTAAAVRDFQLHRGLRVDGICGIDTWSALVEAGYRLGDRLLFLDHPVLRGDDVAELQRNLGSLGFDAGRVDGIFGPRTERALADFQRNAGVVSDAVCGPSTLAALARLGEWSRTPHSVATVRERERVRRGPTSIRGRTFAIGEGGGLDAAVHAVASAVSSAGGRTLVVQHPDDAEQAAMANAAEADAYVCLALEAAPAGPCSTAYYRSPSGWESQEGRRLADLIQAALPAVLGVAGGGVRGMSVPVLRETRMPAVVVELGDASAVVQRAPALAAAITDALERWVAGASSA